MWTVSFSTWTNPKYTDMRWTDLRAIWYPYGLSGLQGILNGNNLRPTINPNKYNFLIGKGFRNMRTFMMIFPVRKYHPAQGTKVGSILL